MTTASPCPRCGTVGLTDQNQTCQTCGYPTRPKPAPSDVVTALSVLALLEAAITHLAYRVGHDVEARADHSHALLLRHQVRVWLLERFVGVADPALDPVLQGLVRQTVEVAKGRV